MSREELFERYRSTFHEAVQSSSEVAFGAFRLNYRPLLPNDHKAAILDLGCGAGAFLRYLASEDFHNVLGVEVSRDQVESCSASGLSNVVLVDSPLEFLQMREEAFDFVMMRDVLEHIEKPEIIPLLECARNALRPGGVLVLRVPNAVGIAAPFSRYLDFTHELSFTEVSLAQVLKTVDFSEIKVLPKKTFYRSGIKGWFFERVRSVYYGWLRWLYFVENPGDKFPQIFTNTIIGVARR